jgi:hypothetical protein
MATRFIKWANFLAHRLPFGLSSGQLLNRELKPIRDGGQTLVYLTWAQL